MAVEAASKVEQEAVRDYRRNLRFKAAPAPDFQQLHATNVQQGAARPAPARPLTVPKSPQLGRKRKATDEGEAPL